jgi:GMP reductase
MKNTHFIKMEKFDYEDINLIPKKCIVNSRSECDTKVKMGKLTFNLPVVPANMECVINDELAIELAKKGLFYIHHRFSNIEDRIIFVKKVKELGLFSSVSVGVNEDSYEFIDRCLAECLELDYVTIDVAHGHSDKVKSIIEYIKLKSPETFVIAGNVSTKEAVDDLTDWGADALKCGVSNGSACTTWHATGFGSRNCQASTIYECAKNKNVFIIADGGIRYPADITKSIVLGADMVMVGGMLTGFDDSPGEVVEVNGKQYKEYWGSASKYQSGKKSRIEGKKTLVDFKDRSIFEELKHIEESLQSSISYGGGNKLKHLRKVKFH